MRSSGSDWSQRCWQVDNDQGLGLCHCAKHLVVKLLFQPPPVQALVGELPITGRSIVWKHPNVRSWALVDLETMTYRIETHVVDCICSSIRHPQLVPSNCDHAGSCQFERMQYDHLVWSIIDIQLISSFAELRCSSISALITPNPWNCFCQTPKHVVPNPKIPLSNRNEMCQKDPKTSQPTFPTSWISDFEQKSLDPLFLAFMLRTNCGKQYCCNAP